MSKKSFNFNKYLDERYKKQIDWYDSKSKDYKKYANILQITVIVFSAIIPIFASLSLKWLTIISAGLVAIGTGILKYTRVEESWHSYRTVCETLKKEKYYFNFKIGPYSGTPNPEEVFVDRIESIISKENTMWIKMRIKKKKKEN